MNLDLIYQIKAYFNFLGDGVLMTFRITNITTDDEKSTYAVIGTVGNNSVARTFHIYVLPGTLPFSEYKEKNMHFLTF